MRGTRLVFPAFAYNNMVRAERHCRPHHFRIHTVTQSSNKEWPARASEPRCS